MQRFAILAVGIFLVVPATRAQQATFEGLGDLPGGDARGNAFGVSADGSVVVGRGTAGEVSEAFHWEAGVMTGLGDLPGGEARSFAYGASGDGSVVVGYSGSAVGPEAFRWEDGVMEGLGFLEGGSAFSEALDVSADGAVVVGISHSSNGQEAFRWEDGVMTGLGNLPNAGGFFLSNATGVSADGAVVVGTSLSDNGNEAFRWEDGVMEALGDLGGSEFGSYAYGVSANGQVVVGYGASADEDGPEAFRWQGGEMEPLGDLPGGFGSYAYSASATGSTIVGWGNTDVGGEAFIWRENEGMQNLKEVLESEFGLDLTGWVLLEARGVSDDGTVIVGYGTNPVGELEPWRAVLSSPVASQTGPDTALASLTVGPNPTQGQTAVRFAAETSQDLSVAVFDVAGREVATLFSGAVAAGQTLDLRLDATSLSSGVYIVRATGASVNLTARVTVVQ